MLFVLLLLCLALLAIAFVAFWIDRENAEEMHSLMIVLSVICAVIMTVIAPWQVKIALILPLLNLDHFYPLS